MPYKDPEKRRACSRDSKRRSRARLAHPLRNFRAYVCMRFPQLNIGITNFNGGFLITDRRDVQDQIGRHPEFGRFIFPLCIDMTLNSEDE
jgi:hypothetical protein